MLSENEFESHPCSEKMKCLIGDCLRNESGSVLFNDSLYLLFLSQWRQADLHLFNKQFTQISQSIRIKEIDSLDCCTSIEREACFVFIYTDQNEVVALLSERKANGFEPIRQISRIRYSFQANDGFKCLSKPFKIHEGEGILAYSQKDQFYLISLAERGRSVSLQVTKLSEPQKSNTFWTWLTRQRPPHYDHVKLVPLYDDKHNGVLILCLRNNTAVIFRIGYNEQVGKSTIRQLFTCTALPFEIDSSSKALQANLLSQNIILVAYSLKERVTLVKLEIFEDENSILCRKIPINAPETHFSLVQCKNFVYLCMKEDNEYRFKCFKMPSDLKQLTTSPDLQQIEAIFEAAEPICLSGNKMQLFLINDHGVYKIEEDNNHYGVIEQTKKFQSFEKWIERTINKKIKKHTLQQNYDNVRYCLNQKQQKYCEEYQHLSQETIEPEVAQKITENIICCHIVKAILSKREYFNKFVELLEHPTIQSQIRHHQQAFIDKILITPTPANIQSFLKLLLRFEMQEYFNDILGEVNRHPLKEECKVTINKIFESICTDAIHSFKSNHHLGDIIQHKILLEFTFNLIDIKEQLFFDDFLFLTDQCRVDEVVFTRNLVLNLNLTHIFMFLFVQSSKHIFTTDHFKEIIKILNEQQRQIYFRNFFVQLKQAYNDSEGNLPRKKSLLQRTAMLVQGLTSYADQVNNILKETFPGLTAYFYLKSQHKQQYEGEISEIAEKCTTPTAAYMLFLSSPGTDKKYWRQTLQKIRLYYHHNGDVLKDIEENKNLKKTISQVNWRKSVEILEIPSERAERIAKQLQIKN